MNRLIIIACLFAMALAGCTEPNQSQEVIDKAAVQHQQKQYAIGQPIPAYDWSLERDLLIQLYNIRNQRVATHSIWRSDYGMIEGDCASIGYGLPYDTSLTNPLQGYSKYHYQSSSLTSIGQAEPNGVFASTNTAATWVMCVDSTGAVAPVYIEAKVTAYPWTMNVDYERNRATRAGASSVTMDLDRKAPPPPAAALPARAQ